MILPVIFTLTSCDKVDENKVDIVVVNDEALIRNCYAHYKNGLLNRDGKATAKYVNESGLAYYEAIFDYALTADSQAVAVLPIMDKLMVLSFRRKLNEATFLTIEKENTPIFEYAVDNGFVGMEAIQNSEIGEITITNNTAITTVLSNGKEMPVQFRFVKVGGKWKFDAKFITMHVSKGLNHYLVQSGKTENEYIMNILTQIAPDKAIEATIWEPIKKKIN